MTLQPLLAVNTLSCERGGRRLFSPVSLSVLPGDYVELIGANGSGKSTLLRTLAGLRPVVDGFFDEVMVMSPDRAVRTNRLALLGQLNQLFLGIADISLLQTLETGDG